ncbi:hypothetical protein [Erysipelothrix rhusiopathiae]|uniref:hypothetical protein n=1 Tax=Erysipelothrix rhusiopathiae TaxID=1648 RepID=UPI0039E89848
MDLINERKVTDIINNVEDGSMTTEQGFSIFANYLYEAKFKGQLYLDQEKYIVFRHGKRVEDYMNSNSKWFISMPEGSNYSEETKISYIQDLIEEDDKMLQILIKEFNEGILLPEQREIFWMRYILKDKTTKIINAFDLYTDKYYSILEEVTNAVSYIWCLAYGNALSYIEYKANCLKYTFSHNDSFCNRLHSPK